MDKDNRIYGEETQIFCLCPITGKVKFKSTLNKVLITSITDKLFLINTNIRVLYVWFCYFDMAICIFLSMVHGNKHDIYVMIQILD